MADHRIRNATTDDFETIKQMVSDAHLDPLWLKWQNFLVIEKEGRIVAIGQVRPHKDCNELGSLITLPEYQGQGIAADLMQALEAHAGSPLYLVCMNKMKPFYARHGYEEIQWREMPGTLRLKLAPTIPLRLLGFRVIAMRKTWT